ncbi:hypothetical protein [Desulfopila aestuarii]|uniref:Uncharacterized protein n=1 Tax=Desulfopila aestuarii DSM 18488 TaxID=1121416 RepID=A0A1M7YGB8_9BACT|nr:hypothetical protein [Desulfopila aestuarii]SHO51631.1 hypothetical protein SAMN02745220_04101 [Desulfopila aestuarii DSM 18488]
MDRTTKPKKRKQPNPTQPESLHKDNDIFTTDMRFVVTRSKLNALVDEFDESVPVYSNPPVYN